MLLNTKEDWQPEEADIIAWQKTYPAIDVHQELMAMESWCDANPAKRKTKQGIKRFINAWLARAQDKGGSPQVKAKSDRLRSKTVEMQLADVTWVAPEKLEEAKRYYLNKMGYYYDGEIRNA